MYRILEKQGESRDRRDQLVHPAYHKHELLATAPNQLEPGGTGTGTGGNRGDPGGTGGTGTGTGGTGGNRGGNRDSLMMHFTSHPQRGQSRVPRFRENFCTVNPLSNICLESLVACCLKLPTT